MLSIVKGPYLQNPTGHSMTVMWETSLPATSRVDVLHAERIHSGHQGNYKQPVHLFGTFADGSPTRIHQINVEGLEPGTPYYYKVYSQHESDEIESDFYMLKTAAGQGEPFSFTVTSETGGYSGFDSSGGRINSRIFSRMKQYRPDIALFVGDVVHDGKNAEDWDKYFFGPGRDFFVDTPFYSCLGNHEDNASWYYDLFAFPEPKNFYAFYYGDVHFICLDSTDLIRQEDYPRSSGVMSPGNAQYDFLERELSTSSGRWKVVYFHYPPYVSGGYQVEDLRQLSTVFERYGVDLVINSHTIVYERSHPLTKGTVDYDNGIVYIVAGGAGAMPGWLLPKREWHTSQSLAVPHFLQVVVTMDRLEVRAIDDEGRLFDTMRIRKSAEGKRDYT
ncbi:metallophosphoesterase [Paenibacillus sp. MDMC362]|uniref:metallophosphoesterase n=1 Tax=Paenibacillus sp. MDMC362 TaxID=2977365 RepID=UPI000DC51589|nr:metallophosphoesterase [Paenibacillus sp. MDMC362]RAR43175.1 metallophosphoesterase [Paenibacillus sp. MDMC362]